MKHLVIHEILYSVARQVCAIEDAADHNGVVGGIVMAEALARNVATPSHQRSGEETVKEALIQIFEDLLQVVMPTFGCEQNLPPTLLSQQVCFARNISATDIPSISRCMPRFNLLAIKLGQENVRNRMQHVMWSTRKQVRDTYQYLPLAQTNGVVDVREREELNLKLWKRSAWTQLTISLEKNLLELWDHVNRI